MKKINLLFLFIIFLNKGYTQIITVLDAESKKPMGQVTISSQQPKFSTTTNADGKADVTKLQGAEKIEIRSLGFLTEIKSYDELFSGYVYNKNAPNIFGPDLSSLLEKNSGWVLSDQRVSTQSHCSLFG